MEYDAEQEFDGPSKSQRKRDAHRLQELGLKLTACNESQLRTLQLSDKIITALTDFNRLPNSHGARRRQLQFIGKLMRDCDFDELSTALAKLEKNETHKPKPEPESLQWSRRIVETGDEAINDLLELNGALERQKLRQFFRDSQTTDDNVRNRAQDKLRRYLQPFLD